MRRNTPLLVSESIGTEVTVSLAKKIKDITQDTSSATPDLEVNIINTVLKAQSRERRICMREGKVSKKRS